MQKFKIIFLTMPIMVIALLSCSAQRPSMTKDIKDADALTAATEATNTPIIDTFISEKNKRGDQFPEITIKTWDDKTITTKDFLKDQPIMFVMFNPGCGHCKDILTNIKNNLGMFKNANLVFVAGTPLQEQLPSFVKAMLLEETKEIIIAGDVSGIINDAFEYQGIPQIMLYDKNHKLQHIYYSEASLSDITNKLYGK